MRFLTQKQARELDRLAMEKYNIKGAQLMGSAGLAIANLAVKKLVISMTHTSLFFAERVIMVETVSLQPLSSIKRGSRCLYFVFLLLRK